MSRSAFHSYPFLHLNSPSGSSIGSTDSVSISSAGTLCGSDQSSIVSWASPVSETSSSNDEIIVTPMEEIEPELYCANGVDKASKHNPEDEDATSVFGVYGSPVESLEDRKADLDGAFLDTVSGRDCSQDAQEMPMGNIVRA